MKDDNEINEDSKKLDKNLEDGVPSSKPEGMDINDGMKKSILNNNIPLKRIINEICIFITTLGIGFLFRNKLLEIKELYDFHFNWYCIFSIFAILYIMFVIAEKYKIFDVKGNLFEARSTLWIGTISALLFSFTLFEHSVTSYIVTSSIVIVSIVTYVVFRYKYIKTSTVVLREKEKKDQSIKEKPIQTTDEDKYGFDAYALHYAKEIIEKDIHTFAILGGYGYGKSSFANLLWYNFETQFYARIKEQGNKNLENKILRVKIDTWGIPNNKIMGYIIKQIQNKLYQYVDTSPISDIDDKYQKIVSSGSSFFLGIFDFIRIEKSQSELVQDLDDFLFAINKKIFVVIEDFDRLDNQELFANIAAFVDFCKNTKNIYVIITVSDNKLTQLIIRCCVGYHALASIAGRPDTKEAIEHIVQSCYINKKMADSYIKERNNELFFYCLANAIETPRTLNLFKINVITKWSLFINNIDLWDFCAFQVLQLTKNNVNEGDCSGYAYLIGHFEEIRKIMHKYDLFPNNYDCGFATLEDALSEKKNEILTKQSSSINDDVDLHILDNIIMEVHKIPPNQQKIIILLMILAKDIDGQHLLCNEYSNYCLYLETGCFNIQGKATEQKDSNIIDYIEKFNAGEKTSEEICLYLLANTELIIKLKQFKRISLNTLSNLIIYCLINFPNDIGCETGNFVKNLISCLRDEFKSMKEYNVSIKQILNELIKCKIKCVLIFKETFVDEAANPYYYGSLYTEILSEMLENYLSNDENAPENSQQFIISLKAVNKIFLFKVISYQTFLGYDQSSITRWHFLGEWFNKYACIYPEILIPQLSYLCSSITVNSKTNIFFPDKILPFFNEPKKIMEIYVQCENKDELSIKLQNDAREYLNSWKALNGKKTFNQVFIELLSKNPDTQKVLSSSNNDEIITNEQIKKKITGVFEYWKVPIE